MDGYELSRFVVAQEGAMAGVYAELAAGEKQGHWMWFIFPQIQGLGFSFMAQKYAIKSSDEAQAYLQHPVLSERLIKCTDIILNVESRSAAQIFGFPDVLKFCSSMTLFAKVGSENNIFDLAIQKYYEGKYDQKTINLLKL